MTMKRRRVYKPVSVRGPRGGQRNPAHLRSLLGYLRAYDERQGLGVETLETRKQPTRSTTMPESTNMQPLADGFQDAIMSQLREILGGAADAIDGPARAISSRMAIAARRNAPALVAECKAQLRLLLEQHKLKALAGKEAVLDMILGKGLDALFNVAVGGLRSTLPGA